MNHVVTQGVCSVCEQVPLADWEVELLGMPEECEGQEGLIKNLRSQIELSELRIDGLKQRIEMAQDRTNEVWESKAVEAIAHRRTLTDIAKIIQDIEFAEVTPSVGLQAIKALTQNKWGV